MATARRLPLDYNISTFGGSARDYTSLAAWESDTDTDLVSAAKGEVLECYTDEPFYDQKVTISGAIVNSDYFRVLMAASSCESKGLKNNGVKFKTSCVGVFLSCILVYSENYVGLYDFEVELLAGDNKCRCIMIENSSYVKCVGLVLSGASPGDYIYGIYFNEVSSTCYVINCLILDLSGYVPIGVDFGNNTNPHYAYNCTFDKIAGEYVAASMTNWPRNPSPIVIKNCISTHVTAPTAAYDFLNITNITTCSTNDLIQYVDYVGRDLHLSMDDTIAKDNGTDLSADLIFPFDDDIDLQLRTNNAWSIGSDEPRIVYLGCYPALYDSLNNIEGTPNKTNTYTTISGLRQAGNTTITVRLYALDDSSVDSAIFDDIIIREYDFLDVCAFIKLPKGRSVLSKMTIGTDSLLGIVIMDDPENPQNGLLAYLEESTNTFNVKVLESGFWTLVISEPVTLVENGELEVRYKGNNYYGFWYNDIVVSGYEMSAAVAECIYYGIFSIGDSNTVSDIEIFTPRPREEIVFFDFNDGVTVKDASFNTTSDWVITGGKAGGNLEVHAENRIENGSFENYDPATDWNPVVAWNNNLAYVKTGVKSLGCGNTGPSYNRGAENDLGLTGNTWYRFHYWNHSAFPEGESNPYGFQIIQYSDNARISEMFLTIQKNVDVNGFFIHNGEASKLQYFSGVNSGYVDDLTLEMVDMDTAVAYVRYGRHYEIVKASVSNDVLYNLTGVVARYNPINNEGIYALMCKSMSHAVISQSRTNIYLYTKNSGVWSLLINENITYVDGADIEIRWLGGNNFDLYYNNIKVGDTQIISGLKSMNYGLVTFSDEPVFNSFSVS
jgi:hypothetical protein